MKVLILNGNAPAAVTASPLGTPPGTPPAADFDDYCNQTAQAFAASGHTAQVITLREKNISWCTGCWTCWWKTPGMCVFKDDMREIYPLMEQADLIIWASPLIEGTVSALTKKVQDRFIPMVHPYIEVYKGECHHRHRYKRNADVGLIIERGPNDTDKDVQLTKSFFQRYTMNTKTRFSFFSETLTAPTEAVHETLAY